MLARRTPTMSTVPLARSHPATPPTAGSLTRAHLVAMAEAVGLDEDLLEDMLDAIGQCL